MTDHLSHLTLSDDASNVAAKLGDCKSCIFRGDHGEALSIMLDAAVRLGQLNAKVAQRREADQPVASLNARVDKLYRGLSYVESKFLGSL